MLATVRVSLCVCANRFTSDCFSNEGQYKAVFMSRVPEVELGTKGTGHELKPWNVLYIMQPLASELQTLGCE